MSVNSARVTASRTGPGGGTKLVHTTTGNTWRHFALGELNLARWWMLQARHDADHLQQLQRVKASPGFPPR